MKHSYMIRYRRPSGTIIEVEVVGVDRLKELAQFIILSGCIVLGYTRPRLPDGNPVFTPGVRHLRF